MNFFTKKNITIMICITSSVLLFAAKQQPDWLKNYREVFPDDKYVAQLGSSNSIDAAKNEALNSLVQYLEVTVNSQVYSSYVSLEENLGGVTKLYSQSQNKKDIQVSVDITVQAIEYTEPYYVKKEKLWYCVAFFERKKAFEMYKSEITPLEFELKSLFELVEQKDDLFEKIVIYNKITDIGQNFINKVNFATLLSPKDAELHYSPLIEMYSKIDSSILNKKLKSPIYIASNNTFSSVINSALSSVFTENGWIVNSIPQNSIYHVICDVVFNEYQEIQGSNVLYSFFPSVKIQIVKKNEIIYMYENSNIGKILGYNYEKAKAKLETKIASHIKIDFLNEFNTFLGNK